MKRLVIAHVVGSALLIMLGTSVGAAPVILTFEGTVSGIQDPYGSHLADNLTVGQAISYRLSYDLGQDGYYSIGSSRTYYSDEQQPGYERDYFYASLIGNLYMHGNFPLVAYSVGRNEWPTAGNDSFMTRGLLQVSSDAYGQLVLQRSPSSLPAYQPSYFVQNWQIGDVVQAEEQAWHTGPNAGQAYQTSVFALMRLTSIEAVPEPSIPSLIAAAIVAFMLAQGPGGRRRISCLR